MFAFMWLSYISEGRSPRPMVSPLLLLVAQLSTYPSCTRRVTNMEGGHKTACLQGKAKTKVRRGTSPFRVHRTKEKDVGISPKFCH